MKTKDEDKYKICPKVDESFSAYEMLEPFVKDYFELQLLRGNTNLAECLEKTKATKVIVHSPGTCYDLCHIIRSKEEKEMTEKYLEQCAASDKEIQYLFHCGWSGLDVQNIEIINFLEEMYTKYKVPMLLENTIKIGAYDRAVYVVNYLANKDIGVCLDMSHVRAMMNQGLGYLNYYKGIQNCKHIHMSYSSYGDGFGDMTTHGVRHPSDETMIADVKILKALNIVGVSMCPEVMEIDNIYTTRAEQVIEMESYIRLDIAE